MRSTTFSIAFALVLTFALRVHACYSEGRRKQNMAQYEKIARSLGIKESEIACLLNEGDKYEPKRHTIHGHVIFCIHDADYLRHMISAMSRCLSNLRPVTIRKLADGTREIFDEPKMEERVVRRPIEPTTPMRKVAHWLGLQTTERGSCGCTSGCHYCCVNTGLGGDDMCFRVWCGGSGWCK